MNRSKASLLYPCPCCGYLVLFEPPPGTYLICPICFWEDIDPVPKSCLRAAQRHFLECGACDPQWSNQVRCPVTADERIPNWTPLDVLAERDRPELIEQITKAFDGVSREDGVTLHEARVIDDWGGEEERAAARSLDTDQRWQDVPIEWIKQLWDAFSFLDGKGWRYYLPVWMLHALRCPHTTSAGDSVVYSCLLPEEPELREDMLSRFSVLTLEQSRAVCQFLRFNVAYGESDEWAAQKALDAYWGQFCT
ncbi:hypothetical protein J5X98_03990 [Leptothermofonsia sichuanensis E412]|uniref:DUF6714 family protein n=1 Tax=Leptothermofonsia sichuanensis TaxID=2917832 RepID=UPI001CA6E52A|nr:DUF6714 family protein [Leptothermofonsia sichuanensis]QZZ21630.1 hypothetical protein J5X98_03990 [Leptothermofonsia sichuanensis E412]